MKVHITITLSTPVAPDQPIVFHDEMDIDADLRNVIKALSSLSKTLRKIGLNPKSMSVQTEP